METKTKRDWSKINLAKKLLYVKENINYLQKDAKGNGYDYNKESSVIASIEPLLQEVGVLITPQIHEVVVSDGSYSTSNGRKKEQQLYLTKLSYIVENTDNDEVKIVPWFGAGANDIEKGFGSSLTYANRYFYIKYFNIATDKDDPDFFVQKNKTVNERMVDALKLINESTGHKDLVNIYNKYVDLRNEKEFHESIKEKKIILEKQKN